ncbi:MAG: acyltransferase domain-containing protein [Symploca sp. SIO1C2]|nr:acyltransferase domain-containing protein [Symploca sp. SIO1C2]
MIEGQTSLTGREIAIIGMVGRFPGASDLESFWHNLENGVESISFFTRDEMANAGIDPHLFQHPNYVKAKGAITDIEMFDADFFGFTPREAAAMDPQQRIFLECAWQAIETAGYDPFRYEGLIGVYAGASELSYLNHLLQHRDDVVQAAKEDHIFFGNSLDCLSTHVSYKCNLRGPSVTVQTACSTSLVAIHLAYQSLLNYECDLALAGGVSISAPNQEGYLYQEGSVVSPDGHCRVFDHKAKGTIPSNGIGIVVLKRLSEALTQGDTIHAVIKGSAINNDGKQKVGYTAPSVEGQAEAISLAQAIAEVDPEQISYIETHGTGTPLGDPVEIAALTQAFQATTTKTGYCAIGSLKSNQGHLKAAAGVAGVIKTVLCLKHQKIPPSLHFESPNPQIDFVNSPFYVNTKLAEWNHSPRLAGVSSFGIGGTNAHIIIEEAPPPPTVQPSRPYQLLILSARTETALEAATVNLSTHLNQYPEENLADVAFTLQNGRRNFEYRRFVVARDSSDARQALQELDPERVYTQKCTAKPQSVIFLFPGQGSQYVNMGKELYTTEPFYREQVDQCNEWLQSRLEIDLLPIIYPETPTQSTNSPLYETHISQLALFVVEYALAKLLMSWGVKPDAMIGHSIGEYVAACLAGVYSLEEALNLVYTRGSLMQDTEEGAMLSIPLPPAQISFSNNALSLAAINTPSNCVVSGSVPAVMQLENELNQKGIQTQRLKVNRAFHSPLMETCLGLFSDAVNQIALKPPTIPFISNVTGNWITQEEATSPQYWTKQIRQTVRFADGIGQILAKPEALLVEVGPGHSLSTFARKHPQSSTSKNILSTLPHPKAKNQNSAWLQTLLGQLWFSGVQLDWANFCALEKRKRIPLPTYPFERKRYWLDTLEAFANKSPIQKPSTNKTANLADYFYLPSWKRSLTPTPSANSQSPKTCLLFIDDSGVGQELADQLTKEGCNIFTVRVGQEFTPITQYDCKINPSQNQDYTALIGKAIEAIGYPETIIHCWTLNVSNSRESAGENENVVNPQELGFYSLVYLTQAILQYKITSPIKLLVITNQTQAVESTDILHPEKTTLLGPCLVIPQEHPNIRCTTVDIPLVPEKTSASYSQLAKRLLLELKTQNTETIIAYRGSYRLVQKFEPVKLELHEAGICLRQGGVYLITGGLGRLGMILAEYLAQNYQAKLVLISRREFPERHQWDEWLLQHQDENDISTKISWFRSMEEMGAEVQIFSGDISCSEQMESIIKRTRELYGTINGVIHSAAYVKDDAFSPILEANQQQCQAQFIPKIYGTLVLQKLLKDDPVDFYLLMSSLASILGGLGFVAYSAANMFLDALAQQQKHNQNPTPWITVNWDGWDVVLNQDESDKWTTTKYALTTDEGIEAFRRLISLPESAQIAVSTGDLPARIEQWIGLKSVPVIQKEKQEILSPQDTRSQLKTTYVSPTNDQEQIVAQIWQDILGREAVGIYDDFFELNGDSLQVVQVVSRIRETLKVAITPDLFMENPTIAGVVSTMANCQPQEELTQNIPKVQEQNQTEISAKVQLLSDEKVNALLDEILSEQL